jgi:pyruvate/2-oxoglutarate dehydrogenase complex dihydrolipoamide dehydrogenase (E3) component
VAGGIGRYDIVILGGGSGGYACALRAAELGKRVALIEKDKVGGTCLHRGCIPTKVLLHAAEIADQARESAKFGIKTTFEGIEMPGVLSYHDSVVDRLWKGLQSTIASRKIDTVIGDGRLVSPTSVRVTDTVYKADHVVLATGSVPRSLPSLDIDGTRVITSDDALRLDRVPSSVIILGGGVIDLGSGRRARARDRRGELPARQQRQERHPADARGGEGHRRARRRWLRAGTCARRPPGGQPVGELIAEGQLIYNWDAEPANVAQLIHPHPTQAEIIGEAHLAPAGKPLHFHA